MTFQESKWFVLKIARLFVIIFIFVFSFSVGLPFVYQSFAATPPNIITYQGRVLNSNGVPVSSASEVMVFELYDASSGGSCLWSNSSSTCASATIRSVTLTDGLFSEDLGDTGDSYAAITDTIFADNATVYLQVTIGGEILTPRKRITASPYAINAQTVDGLDSTDFDFEQIVSNDGDDTLTASAAFSFVAPTSFTFQDDASNTLMTLTDSGTTGDLATTGDMTVTGGDITLGTTSVFSGGDTASLNNIDAVDATTETTFESAIDSLSNLTTTGTLTSGATGTGFTVDLDSSTLTCTDCLDFTELADSMTLDASTIISQGAFTWTQDYTGSGSGFTYNGDSVTAGLAAKMSFDGLTTGKGLEITSNSASTAGSVLNVWGVNSSATGTVLRVDQSGEGYGLDVVTSSEASADLPLAHFENTNQFFDHPLLVLESNAVYQNTGGLYIDHTNSYGGRAIDIDTASRYEIFNLANTSTVSDGTDFNSSAFSLTRNVTANAAGTNVGGSIFYISDNAGGTSEPDTHTADVVSINQDYPSATGDVVEVSNDGTGNGVFIDQNGNGIALNIDSEATTANAATIDGSALTTGSILSLVGGNLTDDSGSALKVDVTESTETADIVTIQTDYSSSNNDVFRIEADGEVFSDVGFTAGAFSTNYNDAAITSTSAFSFTSPTSFTFQDDASNTLMTLTDSGTTGDLVTTGDMTVTGGDITLGTTSIFSGGDTASLNNIDAIDAITETTFETAIDSLSNLTTTGTLTSGATGAGFTVDLDASTLTCTDCLDFDSLADSMTLDTSTTITGTAGNGLNINRTLTNATSEFGMVLSVTASDTTSGTTEQFGFVVQNTESTEGLDNLVRLFNNDTDDSVDTGMVIRSLAGGILTGIEVSDADITTALDIGNNFFLFDGIREAELSTGTLTWEDTSGNDLMTLLDNGTTGTLTVTDDLVISGDNIDSDGTALVLNDTTAQPVYIGSGTPGTATGDGDLYVTGDLEVDGSFDLGTFNCTNCIDFDDLVNSMTLDADSSFSVPYNYVFTIKSDISAASRGTAPFIVSQANSTSYSNSSGLASFNQYDVDSSSTVLNIYNEGVGTGINIQQLETTTSTLPSITQKAGLAMRNTSNNGMALAIYSNNDANAAAALAHITADNVAFDEEALYLDNDGVGIGLYINQATVDNQTTGIGNQALVIDVGEAASTDEVFMIRSGNGSDTEFRFENAGTAYADGSWTGSGADYAEYFYTTDVSIGEGQVVCRDNLNSESIKRCEAGEQNVVGVISNNPSFVANAGGAEATHENNANYALVGLMGQIETSVTAADGAIAVGDPITASSTAGVAGKASGPAEIIGFALDSLATGTGTITVLVNPQWYAGDVMSNNGSAIALSEALALESLGTAASGTQGVNSNKFILRGSGWNGATAQTVGMTMMADVTDSSDYKLSIQNGTSEVAFVSNSGDLSIAGRLYPSDEGTLQTDKYIYYEGTGDYMRTNAAGWATGSYDFAEMFPAMQAVNAGEVVVFGPDNESVMRSPGTTYDQKIAGIVSTRPGFLAGESVNGHVPIALAGRVPTFVNSENGAIRPGDPLTTSSTPGYAMKATQAGPIVGYAMEVFSGSAGSIVVYVNNSYYDGGPIEDAPAADNSISGISSVSSLDVSGNLIMNGSSILGVAGLSSFNNRWRIEENGDFYTYGRLTHVINSHQNQPVETYATVSTQTTVQLSGTVELMDGNAAITFENIDSNFNDVISTLPDYKVFLTADGPTGALYAINRTINGFSIRESGSTSSATVDWMVIATHKDFEPETSELLEDNIAGSSTDTKTDTAQTDTTTDTNETSTTDSGDTTTDTTQIDTSRTDTTDTTTDTTSTTDPQTDITDTNETSTTDTTTDSSSNITDFGSDVSNVDSTNSTETTKSDTTTTDTSTTDTTTTDTTTDSSSIDMSITDSQTDTTTEPTI